MPLPSRLRGQLDGDRGETGFVPFEVAREQSFQLFRGRHGSAERRPPNESRRSSDGHAFYAEGITMAVPSGGSRWTLLGHPHASGSKSRGVIVQAKALQMASVARRVADEGSGEQMPCRTRGTHAAQEGPRPRRRDGALGEAGGGTALTPSRLPFRFTDSAGFPPPRIAQSRLTSHAVASEP